MSRCFTPLAAALVLLATLAASGPSVEIKGDAFTPRTITITAGQTITFTNDDDDAHTVTATDGSFDSKGLDTNERWRHLFAMPGTYAYFCQLHPFMKGVVIVKAATP